MIQQKDHLSLSSFGLFGSSELACHGLTLFLLLWLVLHGVFSRVVFLAFLAFLAFLLGVWIGSMCCHAFVVGLLNFHGKCLARE